MLVKKNASYLFWMDGKSINVCVFHFNKIMKKEFGCNDSRDSDYKTAIKFLGKFKKNNA